MQILRAGLCAGLVLSAACGGESAESEPDPAQSGATASEPPAPVGGAGGSSPRGADPAGAPAAISIEIGRAHV